MPGDVSESDEDEEEEGAEGQVGSDVVGSDLLPVGTTDFRAVLTRLKSDQPEAAEVVYRRDLRWNQNNGWSLFGLHQALVAQNKQREASKVFKQWQKAWAAADITLTASNLN